MENMPHGDPGPENATCQKHHAQRHKAAKHPHDGRLLGQGKQIITWTMSVFKRSNNHIFVSRLLIWESQYRLRILIRRA